MGDAKPKYLNSPETEVFDKSRNHYGLNRARTSRKPYFLICEGYMDVISLHQAGFTNAVASLGTALTTGHASLIKRYVNEVYLTYDSDEAGTRAALRAMPILKEAGITAKIIRMEPYKDPDEFIKNLGTEAFEERINKARNGFLLFPVRRLFWPLRRCRLPHLDCHLTHQFFQFLISNPIFFSNCFYVIVALNLFLKHGETFCCFFMKRSLSLR